MRCPHCGGITQRDMTTWDGIQSDLAKVGAFLLLFGSVIFIWTWLSYPFSMGYQPSHNVKFRITAVSFIETPEGPVARFELANDSIHQFAQVRLAATIYVYRHGQPDPVGAALPETVITVSDLEPHGSQVFDVPLAGRQAGDLFGWNAKVLSYELPPGYWNRRLQSGLSVRLEGLHPRVPAPFPGQRPQGQ